MCVACDSHARACEYKRTCPGTTPSSSHSTSARSRSCCCTGSCEPGTITPALRIYLLQTSLFSLIRLASNSESRFLCLPHIRMVGSKHRTKGRCCHSLSHSPGLWIYLSTLLFIRTNSYWSHFLLRSPCCTKTLTLKDRIHFNQIYGSNIKNKWLHT